MSSLRLKILDLGDMTFFKNELIRTSNPQEKVISPAQAVLIDHPLVGYILFDTGNDPNWPLTYNAAMKKTYPISRLITITDALKKEGLTPNDISILVLSHLHFDHVGGLRQFSGTKAGQSVIVAEAELKHALKSVHDLTSAYMTSLFCNIPNIRFRTINGSCQIAPRVCLFPQQYHTPGLLGLRVDLAKSGTVLFTSDSLYTRESLEKKRPPGGAINLSDSDFLQNLECIESMRQKLQASLYYGHDIQQSILWQSLGWIY